MPIDLFCLCGSTAHLFVFNELRESHDYYSVYGVLLLMMCHHSATLWLCTGQVFGNTIALSHVLCVLTQK